MVLSALRFPKKTMGVEYSIKWILSSASLILFNNLEVYISVFSDCMFWLVCNSRWRGNWLVWSYVRPHFEKLSSSGFKGKILYIEWPMKWICPYFHVEQMWYFCIHKFCKIVCGCVVFQKTMLNLRKAG